MSLWFSRQSSLNWDKLSVFWVDAKTKKQGEGYVKVGEITKKSAKEALRALAFIFYGIQFSMGERLWQWIGRQFGWHLF